MRRPLVLILPLVLALAACGDEASSSTSAAPTSSLAADGSLAKPTVSIPDQLPTELVVTDLKVGTGPKAEADDIVVVNYVGVRSADGTEFDNSYDRGTPFTVQLGQGNVIAGWDQGLVGVQTGGRRQLDIPADLAYGDKPQGDVIKAGDALTFLIDVVAVLPASDAKDEPKIDVQGADNVDTVQVKELVEGTGATPKDGDNVALQIIIYRADTGEQLNSSWGLSPVTFVFGPNTDTYPGLATAVDGMKIGGRRQAQVPYKDLFNGKGNDTLKLPPGIDVVLVMDLVGIY
ncbi:MAG: FKBP-type peptidyl-prolyl cis-trans isomerase [Ilumatobacteraceae bacterium]